MEERRKIWILLMKMVSFMLKSADLYFICMYSTIDNSDLKIHDASSTTRPPPRRDA